MERKHADEKCQKCQGSGRYLKYGECFSCRGSGEMAHCYDAKVSFLGKEYGIGQEVPFLNTHGKIDIGRITGFYDSKTSFAGYSKNLDGWKNINDIWCNLLVIRTGKDERSPLWKSALEAFDNAEKVKPKNKKIKNS